MSYLALGAEDSAINTLPAEGATDLSTPPVLDLSQEAIDDVPGPLIVATPTPDIVDADDDHYEDPDEYFAMNANEALRLREEASQSFLNRPLLFGLTVLPLTVIGIGALLLLRRRR